MNQVLIRRLEALGLNSGQIQALEHEGVRDFEDMKVLQPEQIKAITGCNAVTASKIATSLGRTLSDEHKSSSLKPGILIVTVAVALAALVATSYVLRLSILSNVLLGIGVAIVVVWYLFGIKRSVFWLFETVEQFFIWGVLFLWPGIIFFICWMIPEFHQPIEIPPQDNVKNWMIVMGFASFFLALISIEASYYLRRKWMIIGNLNTALFWCLVFGYVLGRNGFEYWTVIPFVASLVEAFFGNLAGVQNAWNKNPAQIERDA